MCILLTCPIWRFSSSVFGLRIGFSKPHNPILEQTRRKCYGNYLWNTYCGMWMLKAKVMYRAKRRKKPNLHKNDKNWLCLCSSVGNIIWALSIYWLGWYRFVYLLDWVGFVSRLRGGHRLHADIDTHSRWDKPPYPVAVAWFRHPIKTFRFCMDCHIQAAQWFPSAIRRIITYKWAISGFLPNHYHICIHFSWTRSTYWLAAENDNRIDDHIAPITRYHTAFSHAKVNVSFALLSSLLQYERISGNAHTIDSTSVNCKISS